MTANSLSPEDYESLDPKSDEVVARSDDEAYIFDVSVVSREATRTTTAATYTRTDGLYRVSEVESPKLLEVFEDTFARFESEHDVLGGLARTPGDGFEIHVDIVDAVDAVNASVEARSRNSVIYRVPSDSPLSHHFDTALDCLRDHISSP